MGAVIICSRISDGEHFAINPHNLDAGFLFWRTGVSESVPRRSSIKYSCLPYPLWHQAFGIGHRTSDIGYLASGLWHRVTVI
ncbi:hypothetical protein [Candidatus Sodalis sp. SoCistrobi]|uniref:hypothetical protein n=1 Tax=Candidatus Sodalis sp. SoCistrobi TaxID=1922216 RepID=UPI001576B361|nr:hypothetical protein [Candidatus Sodalis sp. SoCistrobi]